MNQNKNISGATHKNRKVTIEEVRRRKKVIRLTHIETGKERFYFFVKDMLSDHKTHGLRTSDRNLRYLRQANKDKGLPAYPIEYQGYRIEKIIF